MAFGIGDELSVRLSAQTADFTSGMEMAQSRLGEVADEALSAAGSLQFLQGRADETGDELREVGASAGGASVGLSSLTGSATTASTSISGLSTVLTVSFLPALAAVGTALVPVVAALGGLAAIAGGIGFVGLAGTIGAISTSTESLKTRFQGLLDTLRGDLEPFFSAFTGTLAILIETLEDTISEIAPTRAEAQALAAEFANLGRAVIETLPAFVDLALSLTDEFLPAAVDLAETVLPQIPGLIKGLVSTFRELGPELMQTARFVTDLAPRLLDLGFAALRVVGPALSTIGDVLLTVLDGFNGLDSSTQSLLITLGALGPVVLGIASLVGGLSAPILAVVAAIGSLGLAWQQDLGRVRTITNRVFGDIQQILGNNIPQLLAAAQAFWSTWGDEITLIIEGVADIIGTTLIRAIDFLTTALTGLLQLLSGDFKGAFKTFREFFGRWVDRLTSLINRLTGGAFEDLVNGAIDAVNKVGGVFSDFAQQLPGVDFTFNELQQVEFGEQSMQQQSTPESQRGKQRIELSIIEDTDLTDARIEAKSEQVITRRERRAKRDTGGPVNL